MVIKVYVWGFRKKEAVGHTSMLLGDGTYISWWPADGAKGVKKNTLFGKRNKLATNAKAVDSLQEDIDLEGGSPNVYTLTDFDEAAIKRWWEKFKKENHTWHLTNLNCSTVVYRALCAGRPGLMNLDNGYIIWTPWAIENLVNNLLRDQQKVTLDAGEMEALRNTLLTSLRTDNPLESVELTMNSLERVMGGGYRYLT